MSQDGITSKEWRAARALIIGGFFMIPSQGCAFSSYEVSIKNAYMMYRESGPNFGPPAPHRKNHIDTQYGREKFVSHLVPLVGTRYSEVAVYGLAWFGDDRHIDVVATELDEDGERGRVALFAIQQLSQHKFSRKEDAITWWIQSRRASEFSER